MVNFSPDFISCVASNGSSAEPGSSLPTFYPANNTLAHVASHIIHIGSTIGYAHVGLGSDFDGMGSLTPRGLEGVDKFPDLVAELLRRGVGDEDVGKVVGGNVMRVWGAVERVAGEMERENENEDEVGKIW